MDKNKNVLLYIVIGILLVGVVWLGISNWNKGSTIDRMQKDHLKELDLRYLEYGKEINAIKIERDSLKAGREQSKLEKELLKDEIARLDGLLIQNRANYEKVYDDIDNASVNELVDLLSGYKFGKDSDQ